MKNYRAHFPLLKNNPDLIYLDSAATTQKPQEVIDVIVEFYTEYNSNVHRGLYPLAEKATEKYEEARRIVAEFINAEPEEIIFTNGNTEAINNIANSLKESNLIAPKPNIVLSVMEHHSNILPWQRLNGRIAYIPLNNNFGLNIYPEDEDIGDFFSEEFPTRDIDIVSLTHASNVLGTLNDIELIRQLAPNAYLIVDAAQSITHTRIDVKKLDVDFLTFAGHKLYGPMGIGVMYAKKELLEKMNPFNVGGGIIRKVDRESASWTEIPHKFEAGTPNVEGAIGLAAAIKFIDSIGLEEIQSYEESLKVYLLDKLKEVKNIEIFHPRETKTVPVVSFAHKEIHAHDIAAFLGQENICVRAGHHCTQILHREKLHTPATVRVSLALYNSKEEIDKFVKTLNIAIPSFDIS
jgi:cysteine desulfurase/selenocysteine lyase